MAIIPFRKSYQIARLRISSGDLGIAAQSERARRCSATGHSIEAHRKNRVYRSPAEPTLGSEMRFFGLFSPSPRFKTPGNQFESTPYTAKQPNFARKTGGSRQLWRLTGRLTTGQGSEPAEAALANRQVQESQNHWPEMQKTQEEPGFCSESFSIKAERTGFEHPTESRGKRDTSVPVVQNPVHLSKRLKMPAVPNPSWPIQT